MSHRNISHERKQTDHQQVPNNIQTNKHDNTIVFKFQQRQVFCFVARPHQRIRKNVCMQNIFIILSFYCKYELEGLLAFHSMFYFYCLFTCTHRKTSLQNRRNNYKGVICKAQSFDQIINDIPKFMELA